MEHSANDGVAEMGRDVGHGYWGRRWAHDLPFILIYNDSAGDSALASRPTILTMHLLLNVCAPHGRGSCDLRLHGGWRIIVTGWAGRSRSDGRTDGRGATSW